MSAMARTVDTDPPRFAEAVVSWARRNAWTLGLLGVLALLLGCSAQGLSGVAGAGPVDLSSWIAESYPAVSGFSPGVWTVGGGGASVFQSVNGQPTLFYSDFNAFGTKITGKISVARSAGDDDFIGTRQEADGEHAGPYGEGPGVGVAIANQEFVALQLMDFGLAAEGCPLVGIELIEGIREPDEDPVLL